MKATKDIIRWMNSNGVWEKYCRIFNEGATLPSYGITSVEELVDFWHDDCLISSFTWDETEEGLNYWSHINSLFEDWCSNE